MIRWAAIGFVAAVVIQAINIAQLGDLSAALRLGAEAPARDFVESELGKVPLTGGTGHDGYQFFVIARDPLALDESLRPAYVGYRHRRVLFPALSGLGGTLPARTTLYGMALWTAVGVGLAAGATAALTRRFRAAAWVPIGAIANVGMLSSVQLLTADSLAIGLGLMGVVLTIRRGYGWATVLFTAAALTKETSILFALGAAVWLVQTDRRPAMSMLLAPTVAVAGWSLYIDQTVGNGFSSQGNLGVPLVGIARSIGMWTELSSAILGTIALGGVLAAVIGAFLAKNRLLWAIIGPWAAIAIMSSTVVWGDGNNAMRIFSMLWILGLLAIGTTRGDEQPATLPRSHRASKDG